MTKPSPWLGKNGVIASNAPKPLSRRVLRNSTRTQQKTESTRAKRSNTGSRNKTTTAVIATMVTKTKAAAIAKTVKTGKTMTQKDKTPKKQGKKTLAKKGHMVAKRKPIRKVSTPSNKTKRPLKASTITTPARSESLVVHATDEQLTQCTDAEAGEDDNEPTTDPKEQQLLELIPERLHPNDHDELVNYFGLFGSVVEKKGATV